MKASELIAALSNARTDGCEVDAVQLHPADLDELQADLIDGSATSAVYSGPPPGTRPMPQGAAMMFMGVPVFIGAETKVPK